MVAASASESFPTAGPEVLHIFGSEGSAPGQLNKPGFIAFNHDENLVVLEEENHRVQIFSPPTATAEAKSLLIFGTEGVRDGELRCPQGLAIDQQGNMVISDGNNNRICVFDSKGQFIQSFGEFSNPAGIAIDEEGDIIIADSSHHQIQVLDQNGNLIRKFGNVPKRNSLFSHPYGLVIDRNGKIIIADHGNTQIQVFTKEGELIMKFAVDGEADLNQPLTCCLDYQGNILVCGYRTHQIGFFGEKI